MPLAGSKGVRVWQTKKTLILCVKNVQKSVFIAFMDLEIVIFLKKKQM